jgi:hypothetical protein
MASRIRSFLEKNYLRPLSRWTSTLLMAWKHFDASDSYANQDDWRRSPIDFYMPWIKYLIKRVQASIPFYRSPPRMSMKGRFPLESGQIL